MLIKKNQPLNNRVLTARSASRAPPLAGARHQAKATGLDVGVTILGTVTAFVGLGAHCTHGSRACQEKNVKLRQFRGFHGIFRAI